MKTDKDEIMLMEAYKTLQKTPILNEAGVVTHHEPYCAVKDGRAFVGSKEEIVSQVCKYRLDQNRKLVFQFKGFEPNSCRGFSMEYSEDELQKEITSTIFDFLPNYGYQIFYSAM